MKHVGARRPTTVEKPLFNVGPELIVMQDRDEEESGFFAYLFCDEQSDDSPWSWYDAAMLARVVECGSITGTGVA